MGLDVTLAIDAIGLRQFLNDHKATIKWLLLVETNSFSRLWPSDLPSQEPFLCSVGFDLLPTGFSTPLKWWSRRGQIIIQVSDCYRG